MIDVSIDVKHKLYGRSFGYAFKVVAQNMIYLICHLSTYVAAIKYKVLCDTAVLFIPVDTSYD